MASRQYRTAIFALVLAYCLIEATYVIRLPLVSDEFDGAYEAYRLRHEVPYRHYEPYKTVAGYYIESIATFFAGDVWSRITATKLTLAAINAVLLLWMATVLAELTSWKAAAASLLLLIANSNFLERSGELRVDMLTAWAGLGSLLLLLRQRYALAGALCGASFLISQKGALYAVAADAAIVIAVLILERRKAALAPLLSFNATFAAVIAAYIGFWSMFAPLRAVVRTTFLAAAGQALVTFYDIRMKYWTQVAIRNPLWLVLAAVAIIVLLGRRQHLVVAVYALVLLAEAIAYRQPWPYFFPLLWPTLAVLFAFYFAAVAVPRWSIGIIALIGVVYPLTRVPTVLLRDNHYQRFNVALASAMLAPSDTYLAGTDIIHDRRQTLPMLERLDAYMLTRLSREPQSILDGLVRTLDLRPPKILIATYRLYGMPKPLLDYFDANYVRLAGSILGYAPRVEADHTTLALKFAGRYRIDSREPQSVTIDDRAWRSGDNIVLAAGNHSVRAQRPVRLRMLPVGIEAVLDPAYVDEQPFYVNPYDY